VSEEGTLLGLAARDFLIFRSDDEGDGNFVMKYNSALIVWWNKELDRKIARTSP
jgi:hypothetical protein